MAGLPGSPASLMPAGPDEQVRRMRDIERRVDELGPSVARSVAGIVADLQAQQAALAAQVADIAAASAAASAAAAAASAAAADVAAQNVQILALIGAQTTGDAKTSDTGASAVALGTSAVDYATVTFTVPAGFTRATVMGTTGIYWGGGGGVTAWVNISGSLGFLQNNSASFSNLFNSNAVNLTGLTGGGTFDVSSRVLRWGTGTVNAYIVTTATVTYFR